MSWVAVAGGAASLLGGILGSSASEKAAQEQAQAAINAQNISKAEFNTITAQEAPFTGAGYGALSQLNYLLGVGAPGTAAKPQTYGPNGLPTGTATPGTAASSTAGNYGSLVTPFTLSDFYNFSPAYQFQKQQGTQGVLNGVAAGQGALSGAAMKDLIDYNQAQAGTSFNDAFNQYQTQQGNIFGRLSGIAQLGQAAAANTGQQGTALAGQAAQSAQNVGTALAGGTIGSANAWTGALNNAAPWLAYGAGGSGGGSFGTGTLSAGDGYTFNTGGG